MKYGFTQKLFGYFYHNSCMKQAKAQLEEALQKIHIEVKAEKV